MKSLLWLCICGWIGGLLGWLLVITILPVFHIPAELANLPAPPPVDKMLALDVALDEVQRQNWMLGMAFVATCVAGGLLVGAWKTARPSLSVSALVAALTVGLVLSAIAGCSGAWLADALRARLVQSGDMDAMQRSVLAQIVLLSVTGIGLGLSLWVLDRRGSQLIQYGVSLAMAGMVAGFLHPLVGGFALLRTNIELLIPNDTAGQMLWVGILSLCFAITASSIRFRRPSNVPLSP